MGSIILVSGMCDLYFFDGLHKGVGVDVQVAKNGFELDVFFLIRCIVRIFGVDDQVAVIPFFDIGVMFQRVGGRNRMRVSPNSNTVKPSSAPRKALSAFAPIFARSPISMAPSISPRRP